jgi:glutamyl-Q tRNA(Asp) synthetase
MEDLDTPRVVAGADRDILIALERYGLTWDGDVVYQSQRLAHYEHALSTLRTGGAVFDCACSRAELQRAASAPAASDPSERVYPGTCRDGLPAEREARAVRFRAPDSVIRFDDLVLGSIAENVGDETGDFVVKRADGVFAYQLAVVVDDALQGITQVVRGSDLISSTARQIALQRALGYPTPEYAHLPLVVNAEGSKIGKRDSALPLPSLDQERIAETLGAALNILGIHDINVDRPERMLREAVGRFDRRNVPRGSMTYQMSQR